MESNLLYYGDNLDILRRCIKDELDNDYNLAAARYKPQIAEKAPDEDPAELIRATLAIEREIAGGLDKPLRGVEAAP